MKLPRHSPKTPSLKELYDAERRYSRRFNTLIEKPIQHTQKSDNDGEQLDKVYGKPVIQENCSR